ncbi:TIGR03435 family protein [Granulicella aggregans]|uniref:TIGR03435 family protein n=1 Tax=Granulicella aggregans TaxID=474949 RepID=UPI0021E01209|nr:TIGR03435 family protein [Granulicella aggregans]
MSKTVRLLYTAAPLVMTMLASLTWAQGARTGIDPTMLTFEVVSVHPDSPEGMGGMASVQWRDTSYEASHVTVKELIREAYGVEDVQIQNAPKWIDSQPFTVEARADSTAAESMKNLDDAGLRLSREHMLQALLKERFRLTVRSSIKQLPIYEIDFSSEVPGLQRAIAGTQYGDGATWGDGSPMGAHWVSYYFIAGHIEMKGQGASIDQLVDRLNQKLTTQLGRTFVNATNLKGNFDFDLTFTVPWRTVYGPMDSSLMAGGASEEGSTDFSLFSAFKSQLGLKVRSTKGPVRTLWIERVEQPTEN